ncbi:hypothetical protein HRbin15_00053 [bacterium HR15]|nr:hypothetical protein HRbin15_00053 [bacterium HR15]
MIQHMHLIERSGKGRPLNGQHPALWRRFRRNFLGLCAGCLGLLVPVWSQVNTYYGVNASLWAQPNGNMKMDYDHVRQRFVIQYQYGSSPARYATLDLNTATYTHFVTAPEGSFQETLLTVMPTNWGSYAQGTTFVGRASGGKIFAIDPNGTVSTFASGLPSGGSGDLYTTVRWDAFGVANHDLFYANAGTGDVVRLDQNGNVVWQTTLLDTRYQRTAAPEPMIVLGSNPRWGPFQNKLLVGQNSISDTFFVINPATGAVEASPQSSIGGSLESFRIFPFTGNNWALYVSIYGGGVYRLTDLTNIPNLQPGDLFVARELVGGGEVWHVYWDSASNSFITQKIADFSNGFLEDMVFAPVPEPGSAAILLGLAGIGMWVRRRRH